MKDYSTNSDCFILNYKILDNEIIVNFSSSKGRDKYTVPYSIVNEKKILEKMKKQVLKASRFDNYEYEKYLGLKFRFRFGLILFIVAALIVSSYIFNPTSIISYPKLFLDSLIIIFSIYKFTYNTVKFIKFKRKSIDLAKNNLFLENEEIINDALKNNKNILACTKVTIEDLNLNRTYPSLDINKIDKIKLKELKQIIENSKFKNNLKFDYYNDTNEKSKELVKKIK